MKKITFLASHPIQYASPLFAEMERSGLFDLQVWYCSRHGVEGGLDRQFGTAFKWDLPLLEGHRHEFLPSSFGESSIYGFWGLRNFSIVQKLWREPRGVVVVHGWAYFVNLLAIVAAKAFGHRVALRGESPLMHEPLGSPLKMAARRARFKLLFGLVDKFLVIGKENEAFLRKHGAAPASLVPAPYAVDNDRFRREHASFSGSKADLKKSLGLPTDKKTVVSTGKLIFKKRPLDLLRAFALLGDPSLHLVFVGDGELRGAIESEADRHGLADRVTVTGFVNQSMIGRHYTAADLFVMASGLGETWGLSTNEAMNFALPVIVSDLCGCSADLVEEGRNGHVFRSGDVGALAAAIKKIFDLTDEERARMGRESLAIVDRYSYRQVVESLQKNL